MRDDVVHPAVGRRARRDLHLWLEVANARAERIEETCDSNAVIEAASDFIAKSSARGKARVLIKRLRPIVERERDCHWTGVIEGMPTWWYPQPSQSIYRRPRCGSELQDSVWICSIVCGGRTLTRDLWSVEYTRHALLRLCQRSDANVNIDAVIWSAHEAALRLSTSTIMGPSLQAAECGVEIPSFRLQAADGVFGCRMVFGRDPDGCRYGFVRAENFLHFDQLSELQERQIAFEGAPGDRLGDGVLLSPPQRRAHCRNEGDYE